MGSRPKTSLQLYRDCMRLVKHVAGTSSPKAVMLRAIVKNQFRASADELDQAKIHKMKQQAERCLSNYFLYEKTQTDPKLREAARKNMEFKGWDLMAMMKPDEDDPNYDVHAIENDEYTLVEEEEGVEASRAGDEDTEPQVPLGDETSPVSGPGTGK